MSQVAPLKDGDPHEVTGTTEHRAQVAVTLCWLIAANKPFYPVYIWWLTGHGTALACLMLLSMPAFAALPLLARKNSLWARLGVPVLGIADTVLARLIFGSASGVELFLVPCALLAGLAIKPDEQRTRWSLMAAMALVALVAPMAYGKPLGDWTAAEQAALYSLNLYSVTGLSAFILWKFCEPVRA
ncbi:MAG: hypothetical protein CFE31_11150 [Rhizobiales bacterium PAR1]|nr:MAG: hypothetical protein CFE31_11150 [Rhizobiales bacterium PAR1]